MGINGNTPTPELMWHIHSVIPAQSFPLGLPKVLVAEVLRVSVQGARACLKLLTSHSGLSWC